MTTELPGLLLIAQATVERGAAFLRTHRPRICTGKGDRDMATDVDLAIERLLRDELTSATPGSVSTAKKKAARPAAPAGSSTRSTAPPTSPTTSR